MLDFGALPPEINSGRMYAGPGAGSMLAAAAAWQALAEELTSAASGYGSVVSTLTGGSWAGPSSISMAAAAVNSAGCVLTNDIWHSLHTSPPPSLVRDVN